MRILVTGAYGQLGREIKELSSQFSSWEFVFTDIDRLDITDRDDVDTFIKEEMPEMVINCAAYTAVDKAETDHEAAYKLNVLAPGYLAYASKQIGAGFIHISTDYVYNGKYYVPYKESDETSPVTVYGKTKLEGEKKCLSEFPDSVIIRTSWLYSSYGNNFVKKMLQLGKEKISLNVVFDQTGTPTWAADLARAIFKITAIFKDEPDKYLPGIYNFSNEGVISWYDFTKAIFEISGITCNVNPVLSSEFITAAQRPHYSVLNKSKIKATFGIDIPYWKDSLKKCLNIIINTR